MSRLRVFVGSPGDVSQERDIVSVVVQELGRTIGDVTGVELEAVRWETHSWPDIGEDAQDVINSQIGEYDVFVGVMWKRFGTPTHRAQSGTGEEFDQAYDCFTKYDRPKIMFYFRRAPFYTTDEKELSQFRKVIRFRKKLEKLGAYFWEYEAPIDFERAVREHLTRQILELTRESRKPESKVGLRVFMSAVREDSARVVPVYNALVSAGFRPWLGVEDILPGDNWQQSISNAINDADFFLPFISESSMSQKVGYIQQEIRLAVVNAAKLPASTLYIIPVRLDAVEPPLELSSFQRRDLFVPDGLEKLISELRAAREDTTPRDVETTNGSVDPTIELKLRISLSDFRKTGVELRNEGRSPSDASAAVDWVQKVKAWKKDSIAAVAEIDEADARWYEILNEVPKHPKVGLLKGFGDQHVKYYREHSERLKRLEKLIENYGNK